MTCLTTVYSGRPTLRCRQLFTPVPTTFSRYWQPLLWTTNDTLRTTFACSGWLITTVTVTDVTYWLGCNVNGQYIEGQSEPLIRAWNAWFCVPCYFQRGRVGLSLPPHMCDRAYKKSSSPQEWGDSIISRYVRNDRPCVPSHPYVPLSPSINVWSFI